MRACLYKDLYKHAQHNKPFFSTIFCCNKNISKLKRIGEHELMISKDMASLYGRLEMDKTKREDQHAKEKVEKVE